MLLTENPQTVFGKAPDEYKISHNLVHACSLEFSHPRNLTPSLGVFALRKCTYMSWTISQLPEIGVFRPSCPSPVVGDAKALADHMLLSDPREPAEKSTDPDLGEVLL